MRYFTDNPLERMMMQVPRQERGPQRGEKVFSPRCAYFQTFEKV